ncbi:T6SS effector phospholipase Tle3 domain-containing protein [Alcaligenes sp. SDU_A2]|uniref:T6SS effector phospholipase Tle3 domain-containing protein n=1 Tax=Alcaligenes sp. SDU_A2 TaxID=3136634 RepID=UPI00311E849C
MADNVIAQASALTMANRPGLCPVQIPADLPGIVIFIHGVNDNGANYGTVEQGLCQGLNERLGRTDMQPGLYGRQYRQAQMDGKRDERILNDPDTYLYQREPGKTGPSVVLPFYWGLRPDNQDIATLDNPGVITSRHADEHGRLMTRGQYQDVHGNRLDANFAKGGGFFANATNNIPQMYEPGFLLGGIEKFAMHNALGGKAVYAGTAPDRRYFVLAATRLAHLIKTIRQAKLELRSGQSPHNETITIMGHSQGSIITLLAQALLKSWGERCVDCIIMVDTPYSLHATDGDGHLTGRSKLKTLVRIVNAVTASPHDVPALADLMLSSGRSCGRSGPRWSASQGERLDKSGQEWITFKERDNRGKVYLYFCPEDTVTGMRKIQGIGTFGVPDTVQNETDEQLEAMSVLEKRRFFQRMWTRLRRWDWDVNAGQDHTVQVGLTPGRIQARNRYQRRTPGPETDGTIWGPLTESIKAAYLQTSFEQNSERHINAEALTPPHEPELHGGEVVRGGQRPGLADVAGQLRLDEVGQNVALGNQYASFEWLFVQRVSDYPWDLTSYKTAFNEGKARDDQAHNWRFTPRPTGGMIEREETPNEARLRLAQDPDELETNNYHSAILRSPENHRWVTAMDVALGQAITMDDENWRKLLYLMADWRVKDQRDFSKNPYFKHLSPDTRALMEACVLYYQEGVFPDETLVAVSPPPLVDYELTAHGQALQAQAGVPTQGGQP